jgi:hypothetical protein
MRFLNTKPESEGVADYDLKLLVDGEEIDPDYLYPETFRGNPLKQTQIDVSYSFQEPEKESVNRRELFKLEHLVKIDANKGQFVYTKNGHTLLCTRHIPKVFSMQNHAAHLGAE